MAYLGYYEWAEYVSDIQLRRDGRTMTAPGASGWGVAAFFVPRHLSPLDEPDQWEDHRDEQQYWFNSDPWREVYLLPVKWYSLVDRSTEILLERHPDLGRVGIDPESLQIPAVGVDPVLPSDPLGDYTALSMVDVHDPVMWVWQVLPVEESEAKRLADAVTSAMDSVDRLPPHAFAHECAEHSLFSGAMELATVEEFDFWAETYRPYDDPGTLADIEGGYFYLPYEDADDDSPARPVTAEMVMEFAEWFYDSRCTQHDTMIDMIADRLDRDDHTAYLDLLGERWLRGWEAVMHVMEEHRRGEPEWASWWERQYLPA